MSAGRRLRPAVASDSRAIWEWNGAPEVRAVSRSRAPIPFTDHERWFATRLADAGTRMFVVEDGDVACGVIRFERRERIGVCSISLALEARGRGLGTWAIAEAGERFRADIAVEALEASVAADNAASLRAFERAGYRRQSETTLDDGRRFLVLRK